MDDPSYDTGLPSLLSNSLTDGFGGIGRNGKHSRAVPSTVKQQDCSPESFFRVKPSALQLNSKSNGCLTEGRYQDPKDPGRPIFHEINVSNALLLTESAENHIGESARQTTFCPRPRPHVSHYVGNKNP